MDRENGRSQRTSAAERDDNAFLWVADTKALQAAADCLSSQIIPKQLDHWTGVVGPKFSQKDRPAINLSSHYSLQQVESCRNFWVAISPSVSSTNVPAIWACSASPPDKLSHMFGFRLHRR